MNQYLFVYGTLLSTYDNKEAHEILHHYADLVGPASINGKLFMVDYYPGVVKCEEKSLVKGELYQLKDPENLFGILDKYEEYNPNDVEHSEYIRASVQATVTKSGEVFEAWTYLYNQSTEDLELLPRGDFLREYHK
jgi:gamma-glutamylcyclotransferase (GGCT)/AIG2-like uncharacterized protein YtfP